MKTTPSLRIPMLRPPIRWQRMQAVKAYALNQPAASPAVSSDVPPTVPQERALLGQGEYQRSMDTDGESFVFWSVVIIAVAALSAVGALIAAHVQ